MIVVTISATIFFYSRRPSGFSDNFFRQHQVFGESKGILNGSSLLENANAVALPHGLDGDMGCLGVHGGFYNELKKTTGR